MPGTMEHIETINEFKSDLQELDSKAHREIARKLADPNDAVIPYERQRFDSLKNNRRHERKNKTEHRNFLKGKASTSVTSSPRQTSVRPPPSGPSHSYDWALINVYKARVYTNMLPPMDDAPTPIRAKFTAFSSEIIPPAPQPLEHSTMLFMIGRSTGFTMGLFYASVAESTIKSWKADREGALHMTTT